VLGSVLVAGGAFFIPWEKFLGVPAGRHGELTAGVVLLAVSVLLSFSGDAFNGRFRAARKAHQAMFLASFRPWLELLAMVAVLHFTTRFDFLALGLLAATVAFLVFSQWSSRRAMPELAFSFRQIQVLRFRELFRKGIAFQSFSLGNAVLSQGSVLIIQYLLGPAAVALFSTARTLVRSIIQLLDLFNAVIWPELSHLIGAGELPRAARVHRAAVALSFTAACVSVAGLAAGGQTLYSWWTAKTMQLPLHLLLLFLLPIPFSAISWASSAVHVACNRHEGLAVRYLVGTCLAFVLCAGLSSWLGLEGAALSTLAVDLVLIPYVLRRSLELTGDSWAGFATGLVQEVRAASRHLGSALESCGLKTSETTRDVADDVRARQKLR